MTEISPASKKSFSLGTLTAMVVGSMVGGGIFALPQAMSEHAAPIPILIGWLITGLGMLCLALVFQSLSMRRPELDAGVYIYAKVAFGDYIGFCSAIGYWVSAVIGNVSYLVLLFSTLGYFFPAFGAKGNTPLAIVCASAILWLMHYFISKGIKEAAIINQITTIAKIVPLVMFILICGLSFKAGIFTADLWGKANPHLGSTLEQIKAGMLVTAWAFVGIEGASVYSSYARKRSDIGRATVIGFLGVLALLVLINVISLGVMSQPELAKLENPSLTHVMAHVVGEWGATFISVGLLISLAGALLSWTLLCAEILHAAALDQTMPKFLQKTNANDVPINALWTSNIAIQVFLLITLFSEASYTKLIYLAASMILVPYLLAACYSFLLSKMGKYYEGEPVAQKKDLVISLLAVIYSLWLLYAGGMKYLLLSSLLYAPSTLLYIKAKYENKKTIFTPLEKVYLSLLLIAALFALEQLVTHHLTIN